MTIFCKNRPFFPLPLHFARNMLYTAFARKKSEMGKFAEKNCEKEQLILAKEKVFLFATNQTLYIQST